MLNQLQYGLQARHMLWKYNFLLPQTICKQQLKKDL